MIITLIGYRGSGKTTVAAQLAGRLGWECVDADAELEHRAGKSIHDIFAQEGEAEFRRQERELMRELLKRQRMVLAAGGGAVLNEATRREMRAAGPVVWLRAGVESILQRLAGDPRTPQRRPSLTGHDERTEVTTLLSTRSPLYQQCASVVIDTDETPLPAVVEEILAQLPRTITAKGRQP